MEKSIRNDLMEILGIRKEEAEKLIATYSREHNGKIDVERIKEDVNKITNSMIHELGWIYNSYDIRHEMLECGKDRQAEAITSLLEDDDEKKLALSYLPNWYYLNVDRWASTFYHATQKNLLDTLNGGIEEYRKLVDELPYENINRVARTFNMESKMVEFLAKNGQQEDFQKFMTDIEPVRDYDEELMDKYVINYSGKTITKSCPQQISDKLFKKAQEKVKKDDKVVFDRENIMRGLSAIYNNKKLSKDEKDELQDLFMTKSLEKNVNNEFTRLVKKEDYSNFNILKQYLNMKPDISWEEKEKFINNQILLKKKKEMKKVYNEFLENIENKSKTEEITPEVFIDELVKSPLSKNGRNELMIMQDEKTKKEELVVSTKNPIIWGEELNIKVDGTKLKELINSINNESLSKANKELEECANAGIGEISTFNNWKTVNRFSESSENILGAINEEENSPYLTGGELSSSGGLTDLKVKCPYNVISKDRIFLDEEIAEMTPEQIKKFNNKAEPVHVEEHRYRFGRIDGYYTRHVYDFNINGEQYHIKGADWTNGGSYTVVWKGEEQNYPEKAMGLSSSRSEWARNQRGVSFGAVIKFISENPMRFSVYYYIFAEDCDSCGRFPTPHIESMCKDIMRMPRESKLREIKEIDLQNSKEDFINELLKSANDKKELKEKERQAQDLLTEYEKLEQKDIYLRNE